MISSAAPFPGPVDRNQCEQRAEGEENVPEENIPVIAGHIDEPPAAPVGHSQPEGGEDRLRRTELTVPFARQKRREHRQRAGRLNRVDRRQQQ